MSTEIPFRYNTRHEDSSRAEPLDFDTWGRERGSISLNNFLYNTAQSRYSTQQVETRDSRNEETTPVIHSLSDPPASPDAGPERKKSRESVENECIRCAHRSVPLEALCSARTEHTSSTSSSRKAALTCTRRHHRRTFLSNRFDSSSRPHSSCRTHGARSRERERESSCYGDRKTAVGWLDIAVWVSHREPSGLIAE